MGRICCDSEGSLNDRSMLLESSQAGAQVSDLPWLCMLPLPKNAARAAQALVCCIPCPLRI